MCNENTNADYTTQLDASFKDENVLTDQAISWNSTNAHPDAVSKAKAELIRVLGTDISFSTNLGLGIDDAACKLAPTDSERPKYPVVMLINGVGGTGKNTFVDELTKHCAVRYISTIDHVRTAADVLIGIEADYGCTEGVDHRANKDDKYRSFLHDIKEAWTEFSDNPNQVTVNMVKAIIGNAVSYGSDWYDLIVIDCREGKNIEKIKTELEENCGLIVLTTLIRGINDPEQYTNGGDRYVYNYKYDITITNKYGYLDMFKLQAYLFATFLKLANNRFGIKCEDESPVKVAEDGTSTPDYKFATESHATYDPNNVITATNSTPESDVDLSVVSTETVDPEEARAHFIDELNGSN